MVSYNFYPAITTPTRITDTTSTLLDNIFVNFLADDLNSGIIYEDLSDHLPIFLDFSDSKEDGCTETINTNMKRHYSQKNYTKFKLLLEKADWNTLTLEIENLVDRDVNISYNLLSSFLIKLLNEAFPLHSTIKTNNNLNKRYTKPWITPSIIKSCQNKAKLYRTYKRYKNNVSKVKYKRYAKTLKSTIKNAEINYYSSKFKSYTGDYRQTWKVINSIVNPAQNSPKLTKFIDNNVVLEDPKIIADNFNNFFTNIGPN